MRLADTPVPARAGGDEVPAGTAPGGAGPANGLPADAAPAFAAAAAALAAGLESAACARDDLEFEEWPAPKKLAPHAAALAVTAYRDGEEVGTGRLILLHDPEGRGGWTGTFRVVVQVHADVEAEMAADPLLGEVGWSWLTEALASRACGYAAVSGTVTRVITEGYGAKADEQPSTGFELRASWSPDEADIEAQVHGAVLAWADLLAAAAGLPEQGTRDLTQRGRGGRESAPGARRR